MEWKWRRGEVWKNFGGKSMTCRDCGGKGEIWRVSGGKGEKLEREEQKNKEKNKDFVFVKLNSGLVKFVYDFLRFIFLMMSSMSILLFRTSGIVTF